MKYKKFILAMRINLRLIVKFHNESSRLMGNQMFEINNEIARCEDAKLKDMLVADKEIYSKTFRYMLQNNTFLMMYSYLEEFLYCLGQTCCIDTSLKGKGGIERFKPIFENGLGVDLEKDSDWEFICDCAKIRHCILHANGRIDLSTDQKYLESIVSSSDDLLRIDLKRIVVTDEFLEKANKVLYSFIAKVESMETA